MRKAKRNFTNTAKATNKIPKFDGSYEGFAIDHEGKTVYVLEKTDIAINNGNEELLNKFFEIHAMYPNYSCAVLHFIFLG